MSASSRIEAMNPVMRREVWPSCCTLLELSPTNALSATSRSIASRICVRLRLATALGAGPLDRFPDLRAIAAGDVAGGGRRACRARAVVRNAPRDLGQAFGRLEAAGDLALLTPGTLANDAGRCRDRRRDLLECLRRLRDRRELARHAVDGLDERAPQVGDVHRCGQLTRERRYR